MIKNIVNLGDASIYCDFGNNINKDTNLKVIKFFKTLQTKKFKEITNLSPSYNKLIITFDLNETSFNELKEKLLNVDIDYKLIISSQKIKIPICCDNEYALDIERLENKLKIKKKKYNQLFCRQDLLLLHDWLCRRYAFFRGHK